MRNKITQRHKKKNKVIRNVIYGKGQQDQVLASDFRLFNRWKHYRRLIKRNRYGFIRKHDSIIETTKHIHSKVVSSYTKPWFRPGDDVYVIVYCNKHPYGARIVKTTILEVSFFGYRKQGYLINYWMADFGNGHGIEADCIFKTYNEAKFFLHY